MTYPPAAISTIAVPIRTNTYHGSCSPNLALSNMGTATHFSISHTNTPRKSKLLHLTNRMMSLNVSKITNFKKFIAPSWQRTYKSKYSKSGLYLILSITPFQACKVISVHPSGTNEIVFLLPVRASVAWADALPSNPK